MPTEGSAHPEVCVGAVVVDDGRLLVIQRGRGTGVGMWSVPGGRVELGETLAEATLRELREETGLIGHSPRHLGFVERIGAEWHFVIHDYLVIVDDPSTGVAGDDASAVAWLPLDEVLGHTGLVPGLADFLADVGVLTRPSSSGCASR